MQSTDKQYNLKKPYEYIMNLHNIFSLNYVTFQSFFILIMKYFALQYYHVAFTVCCFLVVDFRGVSAWRFVFFSLHRQIKGGAVHQGECTSIPGRGAKGAAGVI